MKVGTDRKYTPAFREAAIKQVVLRQHSYGRLCLPLPSLNEVLPVAGLGRYANIYIATPMCTLKLCGVAQSE